MKINKCLFCGSPNLIADRGLSGRLVCTSCGNPYGVRGVGSNKLRRINQFPSDKKYLIFLIIIIFAFFLVVI